MSLLEDALKYHDLGWSVIPVGQTKRPIIKWEKYQTKRATKEQLKGWWKKYPKANIAIVTGAISNITVIDFDCMDAMKKLEAKVDDLPQTIMQKSGREGGGIHYFFTYTDKLHTVALSGVGIDVRSDGGYIIVAPSLHQSGTKYKWLNIDPTEDGLDDLCDISEELIKYIGGVKDNTKGEDGIKEKKNPEGWIDDIIWGVGKGERNKACAKYAGWLLRANRGNKHITLDGLLTWNERNTPPMDVKELRTTLDSIADKYESNKATHASPDLLIESFKILIYPDGEKECEIKVGGIDDFVRLSLEDLSSSNIFTRKLLKLTHRLFPIPGNKDGKWGKFINNLLDTAVVIKVSEEETNIPIIREVIAGDLSRGGATPEDPEAAIKRMCIVHGKKVVFKLNTLTKHLQFTELKQLGRKKIVELLKKMGFIYNEKPVRIGQKVHKLWEIDYNKWLKQE